MKRIAYLTPMLFPLTTAGALLPACSVLVTCSQRYAHRVGYPPPLYIHPAPQYVDPRPGARRPLERR
jgi:hypothetical protein